MNRIQILWQQVKTYYREQTENQKSPYLGIHDIDHITRVLRNANQLISTSPKPLSLDESEHIQAGAILHDIGYCILTHPTSEHQTHIQSSLELSQTFLADTTFSPEEISSIQGIILRHHDTDHGLKTLTEKVVYVADKLDMIGFDGVLRMYIKSSVDFLNRDMIAIMLLNKMEKRVHEDLLQVGIGHDLIKLRWQESKWLLNEILARGALNL